MKKHVLRIRGEDKMFFDLIKDGIKTIETRAAVAKYKKIEKSDILVFTCGNSTVEKRVMEKYWFSSIDEMIKHLDIKKIMPHLNTEDEAVRVWHNFPDYKSKIAKYGLMAWELG